MPNYLSWNVYHGTIGGVTPVQRIVQIVTVGMLNNVDVICLQECPQTILDGAIGPFGTPGPASPVVLALNAGAAGWAAFYSLRQAWSENNPNNPNSSVTADGYLIFYRNATFAGNGAFGYYQPNAFVDLIGNYLRPPVRLQLNLAVGGVVTVMNWHANTGAPQVASAIAALNALLGNANGQPNLTVVLGDFNYGGPLNNLFAGLAPPFKNWDDWFVNITSPTGAPVSAGLDHILTSQPSVEILAAVLTFKSDAYHYPLAVSV
ncbi:MAG TPA: endonuclease/exonuclease/phosphatase family protein [Actinophytocola sp.]|uniref:endonuclease/exonuclease/phosphatase family protein n=1 Tax=Actinophytocola sp. TaxID=1872138 RepID=UPI002DBC7E9A|nr:endonuclease/exonuclease/phosphatase family protein [Actinophytocola sp.]HEU5469664.1 endonuclease/exonuclease/phosphatase family protein [Actinophytocola sp.]